MCESLDAKAPTCLLAAQAFCTSGLPPALCYEELLAAEAGDEQGFRWVDVDENDACGLCYTSGTTGRPKVRLPHAGLLDRRVA